MNEVTILIRSIARKAGVLGILKAIKGRLDSKSAYEDKFSAELLAAVRPGDVVWDVGANLGLYTDKLLGRVEKAGCVVAFEPAPACFSHLQQRFGEAQGVKLENLAMGSSTGSIAFFVTQDPLSPVHHIVDDAASAEAAGAGQVIEVAVTTASDYQARTHSQPNVVKIDVEGYEEEVLKGFGSLLDSKDLRAVFLEVHFELLEKRGARVAPARIEKRLREAGYDTRWIDASHLRADRR